MTTLYDVYVEYTAHADGGHCTDWKTVAASDPVTAREAVEEAVTLRLGTVRESRDGIPHEHDYGMLGICVGCGHTRGARMTPLDPTAPRARLTADETDALVQEARALLAAASREQDWVVEDHSCDADDDDWAQCPIIVRSHVGQFSYEIGGTHHMRDAALIAAAPSLIARLADALAALLAERDAVVAALDVGADACYSLAAGLESCGARDGGFAYADESVAQTLRRTADALAARAAQPPAEPAR